MSDINVPSQQSKSNGAAEEKRPTSFHRPDLLKVLNKNPRYKYRWVNYNKVRDMGGVHQNGWRILTNASKSEVEILKEHALEGVKMVDGAVRRYEMVLAFMPIDEWKELRERKDFDRINAKQSIRRKQHNRDIETTDFALESRRD